MTQLITACFENDGHGKFTTRNIDDDQVAYDIRSLDLEQNALSCSGLPLIFCLAEPHGRLQTVSEDAIDEDGDFDLLVAGQTSLRVVW